MLSPHLAFLIWLILMALFVLQVTTSPKRRPWRKRLLTLIGVIWILGLALLVPKLLQKKPLFKAVEAGDLGEVKKLLSENPRLIQSRTLMGDTLLHLAVDSDNTNMVALLVNLGVDVNAPGDSRVTPLHLAAFNGNTQIAEALLNAGARINARGFRHDNTPLQVAANSGIREYG